MARRKEIYEGLYPATKQGAKGGWHNNKTEELENDIVSFSSDVAAKTSQSQRTVERKVQIGEALTEIAPDGNRVGLE